MASKSGKPSGQPTAKKRRDPIPQPHGGAIVPGAGGGPQPGSGRPPDEFKAACARLASRDKTLALVEKVLDDPITYASLWAGALKWATEHGYGKPKESIDHTVSGEVTVRFERETNKRTAS